MGAQDTDQPIVGASPQNDDHVGEEQVNEADEGHKGKESGDGMEAHEEQSNEVRRVKALVVGMCSLGSGEGLSSAGGVDGLGGDVRRNKGRIRRVENHRMITFLIYRMSAFPSMGEISSFTH